MLRMYVATNSCFELQYSFMRQMVFRIVMEIGVLKKYNITILNQNVKMMMTMIDSCLLLRKRWHLSCPNQDHRHV